MNEDMELRRRTWIAALKLAFVMSTVAALVAVAVSSVGEVSPVAVVLPVIIVAFVASWVQTGRVRRDGFAEPSLIAPSSGRVPSA